jgi:5-methylcytosine-specific restriction endonuclease McrA
MNDFEFEEDKKYFVDLFCDGDEEDFDKHYSKLFNFKSPNEKRKELNVKQVKEELLQKHSTCQLQISPACMGSSYLQVEHLIPISTNKLNKKLRNIKPILGKKVPTQSFGSNHISNLVLACKKCNSLKKHRLPDEFPKVVEIIKERITNE